MRLFRFRLGAASIAALLVSACAGADLRAASKDIAALKESIPGSFVSHRYAISDPTHRFHDVIKIAYVRENATQSVLNPFSPLNPIVYILPFPFWNNGESVFDRGAVSGAKTTNSARPDDAVLDRFVTLVVDDPGDLDDYDIVIRERFEPGARRIDRHFTFAFLFIYRRVHHPATVLDVTSDHGISFQLTGADRRKGHLFLALLPLYTSNRENADSLLLAQRLYNAMVAAIPDPAAAIRARKRRYAFAKDPALESLETMLRREIDALEPATARRLLAHYKLRFDFLEHRRMLEELRAVDAQAARFNAEIARRALAPVGRELVGDLAFRRDPFLAGRIDLGQSRVDVRFGRNYDLYDAELSGRMLSGPLETRQYPIEQLRGFAADMAQFDPWQPAPFVEAYTTLLDRLARSPAYRLPEGYEEYRFDPAATRRDRLSPNPRPPSPARARS